MSRAPGVFYLTLSPRKLDMAKEYSHLKPHVALKKMEADLRDTLASAKARKDSTASEAAASIPD